MKAAVTPQWKLICRVDDILPQGSRRRARSHGPEVAIFRAADDPSFALLDKCPRKGGPLSHGIVFGHSVAGPLHNWSIALDSGEARAPDVGCAKRFAASVDKGEVFLDGSEPAAS